MTTIKSQWPVLLAIIILLTTLGILIKLSLNQNDGHFVYALDDAYIHMAMARNFVRYHIWGITRYEFSSSTSAPLWTLLLGLIYLFTTSAVVPLILNVIFGVLLLLVTNAALGRAGMGQGLRLALLLALIFLIPLPSLILTGMEHTAQIVLCIALAFAGAMAVTAKPVTTRSQTILLLFLGAVAPVVRYESLFLILGIIVLLLLSRRFGIAIMLSVAALLPLAIYGMISLHNGSFGLPNSVLLKGSLPSAGLTPFLEGGYFRLRSAPHLLLLWLSGICLLIAELQNNPNFWRRTPVLLVLFLAGTALHALFAGIGWFYRYEAYLVGFGIIVNGESAFQLYSQRFLSNGVLRRATAVVALVLSLASLLVLGERAYKAIRDTVPATRNTYDQQYQMATFLQTYYQGEAVALNDIGATNYLADIRTLDLLGLGSAEITRAKLRRQYRTSTIEDLARRKDVKIALIYSGWFENEGGVPTNWTRVGQWTIPNCVVSGNPTVTFYAVQPGETERLKHNLKDFSSRLPIDVAQAGFYTEANE